MNFYLSSQVGGEMNQDISNQESPTPEVAVLKFLQIVAGDTSLVLDFSRFWVMREFQLGDELNNDTDEHNFLYFICQGRVRLLGFNATLNREVSTQLILAEHCFGADNLFADQPLPYRAIAASHGYVACIAIADLKQWLECLPGLEIYLRRLINEQQALVFLKSYTELRSLNSNTVRQLLPYFVATEIAAGSFLGEVTTPTKGRFWLARGTVDHLQMGDSWGYPDDISVTGIAATDLLVYRLSPVHWETVRTIAPQVFAEAEVEVSEVSQVPLPALSATREEPLANITEINFLTTENQPSKPKLWREYPFVQQQNASDGGAACLAMISQYWGKYLRLYTLRNLAQVDRMGSSIQDLAAAAETLGYDVLPVQTSLDKFDAYPHPWIAQWQEIHYIVVWQVKGDRLLISDPAVGKTWVSRAEFITSWTGCALLLNPTEYFHTLKSEAVSWGRYKDIFWHYRKLIGPIILSLILVQLFGLATPLFTQIVIDQVIPRQDFETLNIFIFSFLGLGIWRTVLIAQRQYLLEYVANRIDFNLIGSFINYTLRLPLQFFASRQVEDILSRVPDNSKIQFFLTQQAIGTIIDVFMVVIYLGLITYYNWRLTYVVLGWLLLIVIFTIIATPSLKKASQEILKQSAGHNSAMLEMMTGIVTVKTTAAEYPVQMHWEEQFQQMLKLRLRGRKLASNWQLIRGVINQIGTILILWFGANMVINRQMSLGKFVAINLLTSNIIIAVMALVGLWYQWPEIQMSLEKLEDIFASQPEDNSPIPLLVMPVIQGEVHFANVSFAYNLGKYHNTLENISFVVQPRQIIGIVGRSGAGKTTLINLLAGLYRPHTGQIFIDGQDIALVSPQSLRSQLIVVPQESYLFSGSILENITLYSSEFTLEQAIAAAVLADAHTFIQALPLGYNTQVGERGMMLSSGQKQKIAIARALIRNPKILILDEATSSLDSESEIYLQQNLTHIKSDRTTFIVSHRLANLRQTDYILVLDRGILVEQGTHQQLTAKAGLYHHLTQPQLYP